MRIFIASADKSSRMALQLLLESEPGMAVIGIADRTEGLLTLVQASQPKVLLLDYELARQTTVVLISDLLHLEQPPKIIVLSVNPLVKATTLAAGADGFIGKDGPADALLPMLREIRAAGAQPLTL